MWDKNYTITFSAKCAVRIRIVAFIISMALAQAAHISLFKDDLRKNSSYLLATEVTDARDFSRSFQEKSYV